MNDQITRGHCLFCLRLIAIQHGRICDHGYDIGYGYRNGSCPGAGRAPANANPEGCADTLEHLAKEHAETEAAGVPELKGYVSPFGKWVAVEDMAQSTLVAARREAANNHAAQLRGLLDLAKYLKAHYPAAIAAELVKEDRPVPAAPIKEGERRINENGRIYKAKYQDGQMVVYVTKQNDKVVRGKMAARSWRLMEMAPPPAAK